MGFSLPSIPGVSTIRNAVVNTATSAGAGLRDFGTAAVARTADLGQAGLDIGRGVVKAIGSVDVRATASTVRHAISSATETARDGIKDGTMWAGQQTHRAADFARDHVPGDNIASRAVRGAITLGEDTTRFQLGVTGGVAREAAGLVGTVGELATTSVEMQLSPQASAEYGQKILGGARDAAVATATYATHAAHDPGSLVRDAHHAVDVVGHAAQGQLDRYGTAIREGHGPETIGMDVGTVATYVVPVGGGPIRGAVTAAVRGGAEAAGRGTAEVIVRGTTEATVRGTESAAARGTGEIAARETASGVSRTAETAKVATRSVEAASSELRGVVRSELDQLRSAGASNKRLGPAISAVMDRTTGKISTVATNNAAGELPRALNPALADRIAGVKEIEYIKTAGAGSHAEVYAVNEMLNQGSRLEDLVVYTEQVGGKFAGGIKPPCPHCAALLEGVTYAK